ncbi:hypothetical protein [Flavobacterium sp.]|jgi:hypothetical protein|uniref:hypothetical protein n=1 Tax=Flavobacterium sp. TaxID=239 RepID=UPI0037BEB675
MPKVAFHDVVIQMKAKELIVGTHGRSIYKIDISKVQELTKEVLAKNLHLFKVNDRTKSDRWGATVTLGEKLVSHHKIFGFIQIPMGL